MLKKYWLTSRHIPPGMVLDIDKDSGVYMGLGRSHDKEYYVGKRATDDGNILTIGINGSGKSHFLVKPTLRTWRDPVVALDIKGELARFYTRLIRLGNAKRPYILFSPADGAGHHYDVYALLEKDDPHFVQYVREIAYAIIPMPLDVREPYWINMARDFLSGAIIYCFDRGYDFIDTILLIHTKSVADLCREIMNEGCTLARTFISEISSLKSEQKAAIGTEVKQHTMVFATDPHIQDALSRDDNNAASFSWKDIVMSENAPNVFLCLDQSRLEPWSGVIRLMITQLIRQIERRPESRCSHGAGTEPLLLLLDEFPLLGKMDVITNAITTLRSKKVTLQLVIQSLAQLDAVYGPDVRKILVDNCQYKEILSVTEPDTQEYLSKMIGTTVVPRVSVSQQFNAQAKQLGFGMQVHGGREPVIQPFAFGMNTDIWLHTPYGFLSTIKSSAMVTDLPVREINEAIKNYLGRRRNNDQ